MTTIEHIRRMAPSVPLIDVKIRELEQQKQLFTQSANPGIALIIEEELNNYREVRRIVASRRGY
ncbi:MAG: hypothetical protein Solivirus1_6 [Solivirus sp.]|uniref:Uncharacterized protein n=1 Tax=Solivirus sp. TaxID=2487772 RepID=A0A3G5AJP4_9VIRU|nr:MAG: hypothetical protein Solivirus1_6 [Solivirus sp.]